MLYKLPEKKKKNNIKHKDSTVLFDTALLCGKCSDILWAGPLARTKKYIS